MGDPAAGDSPRFGPGRPADPAPAAAAVESAAEAVRACLGALDPPRIGVIAGSGLSSLAERLDEAQRLSYATIPGWPLSTVAGHAGALVLGRLAGRSVVLAAGRAHLYEGYSPAETAFGVRVLGALGVETLVVTNAAGALNPAYRPGDLMVIADHIYLPGMAGANPLAGPNDDRLGPRFPVIAGAYDPALSGRARQHGARLGFRTHAGVYAMVAGPSFETPAEARFLRAIGADAVGMSTAPEVVVARHAGMRVLGLSLISNLVPDRQPSGAAEDGAALHAEVMAAGADAAERLGALIADLVAGL